MSRPRRVSLGVDWHLPVRRGLGFQRRPFATSTVASANLIAVLAGDGLTWSEIHQGILYDPEAKIVCQGFIDAGFGDAKAAGMLA